MTLRCLRPRLLPATGQGWAKEGRGSRHERGLGTVWDKLRLVILRRDNGLCQCDQCKGGEIGGKLTPASEVHHIVGRAKARRMGWTQEQIDDPSNLAAINRECHKRATAADSAEARRGE